ncbi:MAG TPA: flagellar export chaperone FliS [Gammaproteobacteria bacterium]|nr:flagellar export chaperone FliS [Gammaproteobacteria bacterium]
MSFSNAQAALQQYKKINVHSQMEGASPHRLIQMLMEGALEKIHIARGLMEDGKIGPKGEHIGWAISIIDGLRISLDKDVGGEIAQNLEDLYDYMTRRLIEANLQNDVTLLDEVGDLLRQIKEAWDAIGERTPVHEPAA